MLGKVDEEQDMSSQIGTICLITCDAMMQGIDWSLYHCSMVPVSIVMAPAQHHLALIDIFGKVDEEQDMSSQSVWYHLRHYL